METKLAEQIGFYIGIGGVIAAVIWIVVALIKYKPIELLMRRWENVKYLIKQLILMYSDQKSIFAKKRVESGLAFYFLLSATGAYLYYKRATIDPTGFIMVTAPVAAVAGWSVKLIQDEKKMNKMTGSKDDDDDKKDAPAQ